MADVTVERSAELTKEVALLKSRNKALSNIVDVDKDVLIKSKEQATALGELGDNVKSIGNNLLSGAENLTTSIFGGALGGVLNSLTIGMIKRKNENAKIEKEKAKEQAKATAADRALLDKQHEALIDNLELTEEYADSSREEILQVIKKTELAKEELELKKQRNEEERKALEFVKVENEAKENGGVTEIDKQIDSPVASFIAKENGGVTDSPVTSFIQTAIDKQIDSPVASFIAKENGGIADSPVASFIQTAIDKQTEDTAKFESMMAGFSLGQEDIKSTNEQLLVSSKETAKSTGSLDANKEDAETRRERIRLARDKGGEVSKIKLEGAEDTSGFSLMDIFSKGGRGKLLGSLATGLTGIASFAFSPQGGLFSAMKGVNFGKVAGAGMLAGGLMMMATDGLRGITKAKAWGVGTENAAVASALGGVDSGVKGMFSNAGKWALIGAGIGSFIPGIGTLIGGIVGGLFGAILGFFGGEKIANFFKDVGDFAANMWNKVKGIFDLDDKEMTKQSNIKEIEEEKKELEGYLTKEKDKKGKTMEQLQAEALEARGKKEGRAGNVLTEAEKNQTISLTRQGGVYDESRVAELERKISGASSSLETEKGRDVSQEIKDKARADILKLEKELEMNESAAASGAGAHVVTATKESIKQQKIIIAAKKKAFTDSGGTLARGGFIVNQPTYLPNSGVVVGEHGTYSGRGAAAGGIADGGPEAVIPLSSTRSGAFIDPMAQSVAGQVLNQLAMSRVGMDNSGGGGANVVTGNDMSSNQVSNNTTVINNPSPIGQTLPDEGRDFVSKVA